MYKLTYFNEQKLYHLMYLYQQKKLHRTNLQNINYNKLLLFATIKSLYSSILVALTDIYPLVTRISPVISSPIHSGIT